MQDQKAPGPDGLPTHFYKKYWKIVGSSIIKAVQSFFTFGKILKEVNSTLIALVPKVPNPSNFNHFRPISLCNVVYKVISKLIVSRLRPLLHKMILPYQSTFIPGRWIVGNQLLVQEILHSFKKQKGEGWICDHESRPPKSICSSKLEFPQNYLTKVRV